MDVGILTIAAFGLGLSLLLVFIFLSKKKASYIFLAVIFMAFAFQLFEEIGWISGLVFKQTWICEFSEFSIFLIAPSLYLYALTQSRRQTKAIDLLHYLPALLVVINFLPLYLSETSTKLCYINEQLLDVLSQACNQVIEGSRFYFVSEQILDFFNVGQLVLYLGLSIPLLREISNKKARRVEGQFMTWTRGLTYLFASAIVLVVLDLTVIHSKYELFSIVYLTLIALSVAALIMSRSVLLSDHPRADNYSSLSNQQVDEIIEKVQKHIANEGVFRKKETNMAKVADELSIPRNKVQHAFRSAGIDFKEILNKHRIQKSKELIIENPQFTIEAIGELVGYSSKATFYKYFKRFEGQTPSQYISAVSFKKV